MCEASWVYRIVSSSNQPAFLAPTVAATLKIPPISNPLLDSFSLPPPLIVLPLVLLLGLLLIFLGAFALFESALAPLDVTSGVFDFGKDLHRRHILRPGQSLPIPPGLDDDAIAAALRLFRIPISFTLLHALFYKRADVPPLLGVVHLRHCLAHLLERVLRPRGVIGTLIGVNQQAERPVP